MRSADDDAEYFFGRRFGELRSRIASGEMAGTRELLGQIRQWAIDFQARKPGAAARYMSELDHLAAQLGPKEV